MYLYHVEYTTNGVGGTWPYQHRIVTTVPAHDRQRWLDEVETVLRQTHRGRAITVMNQRLIKGGSDVKEIP
jgi:hypothetical protein